MSQDVMASDLPLPPLCGVANDYSFLQERLKERGWLSRIAGYAPTLPISVVVTVHNRARLLELCLESLSLQDYPRHLLEVIVVDDKSSDDPAGICARSSQSTRFIRTGPKPGHTEALARNTGIRAASHPVIVQMDPDIVFLNRDALRWIARWFEDGSDVVVTVSRTYIHSEGVTRSGIRDGSYPRVPTGDHDEREILRRDPDILKHRYMAYLEVLGFCMAYRRSSAFAAGLWAEEWTEYGGVDQEFAYRLYERGAYCIHEPHVEGYHLHHPKTERSGRHRDFLAARVPPYRVHRYPGSFAGKVDTPRCSVYIPVRNGAEHIGEAVDSALRQTCRDLEVIVVDDGSTDQTPAVVREKARQDQRVVWQGTPPRGCASASNTAIGRARAGNSPFSWIPMMSCTPKPWRA
ncbi:MAG: glycosyltransferase [Bryobacteraceae bacterium]